MATSNKCPLTRSSARIGGVLLIVTSVPLFFLALLLGSGGEMIAFESAADHARLAALVSFPALICAVGAALLWGSRIGRYRLSIALALLTPVDVAAIVGTFWLLERSEPAAIIASPDPHAVIRTTPRSTSPARP